jgi:hypothetical protein
LSPGRAGRVAGYTVTIRVGVGVRVIPGTIPPR